MIRIYLPELMKIKGVSQRKVSHATGVRLATINALCNEYAKRVNFSDLDKLCVYFKCKLSDLIEYVPDNK